MLNIRFYDLIRPEDDEVIDDRSGDDIAADIIKRAGLVVQ